MNNSLGLVEVKGFCASIFTVDALLKNSSVAIGLEEIRNGNVILKLKGTLPQINYAINLAIENANKISSVIGHTVLEKLNPEIEKAFFRKEKKSSRGNEQIEILNGESLAKAEKVEKKKRRIVSKTIPDKTKHKSVDAESSDSKNEIKYPITAEAKSSTLERLRLEALGKKALQDAGKISEKIKTNDIKKLSDLDGLNVHKLRRAARDFDNFPIKGRQISRANRDELMVYFKQILPE
ncbi:Hypothetical protein IALB_1381 [Ignavibacterium album JCM 16511]|uniref:Bacterial microcompartment domain-containing protein n=1 Tax=Ignavibacterium album (strain DSM 19864 / JCM 16511 / NBRC 101810 / Mat9-16) TaxID=945713 RepID=I0AJD4_IGNAJ|nr:BMC domain-containing protein [Ignavibacterium album]AFH49091.1 Hypothetical protein IALB_1381 [Ignavibacterium album JCM 16511]